MSQNSVFSTALAAAIALAPGAALMFVPTTAIAQAQNAKGSGVFAGIVRDTAGNGLPGVSITLIDARNGAEFKKVTEFNGRFAIPGLDLGIQYSVRLAKLDFYPVTIDSISIPATKVLRAIYTMHPNRVQQLEKMTITERSKGSKLAKKYVDAAEIAKANVHSALDAVQRLRPIMLQPNRDICITNDSLSLYVDGVRRPVYNPRDDGFGGNPRTVVRPGLDRQTQVVTGRTNEEIVRDELSAIPADEVGEITFVSCDDFNPKINKRNAIWLLTKRYLLNAAKYGLK